MLQLRLFTAFVLTGTLLALSTAPVAAQQNQQWFVPNQPRVAPPRAPARPAPPPPPEATGAAQGLLTEGASPGAETQPAPIQLQLPPPPEVPPLPKGPTPPAAIVGVLSVADVMRVSTAFQQADKEFVTRRQKLNEDAQKEQVTLRDLGQALANERNKLTPEQIRGREKELQDRITESRRVFGERNRVIQEASQYVMAQIERAVELVTQQVAVSRGINLVLNRAQILGTTAEFDMTPAVVEDLNKVMASVTIPPDGVSPVAMQQGAAPANATQPASQQSPSASGPPAKPSAPPPTQAHAPR